ncbi:MAG: hypothetical protein WDO56_37430 [Gammaproteobacteria bacterium]
MKDTPTIVTPSGVAGLSFLDEAATVNSLVPALRARGVETIVVLIHQGRLSGRGAEFHQRLLGGPAGRRAVAYPRHRA